MSDINILRRIAERGLKMAQNRQDDYVDIFQHMLDEVERFEKEENPVNPKKIRMAILLQTKEMQSPDRLFSQLFLMDMESISTTGKSITGMKYFYDKNNPGNEIGSYDYLLVLRQMLQMDDLKLMSGGKNLKRVLSQIPDFPMETLSLPEFKIVNFIHEKNSGLNEKEIQAISVQLILQIFKETNHNLKAPFPLERFRTEIQNSMNQKADQDFQIGPK